jgi:prevent-host-death family protein
MNNMYRFIDHYMEAAMKRELGITEARKQFASIVDEVKYRGDNYVILKRGEPAAAIVPMDVYRRWQEERERLFDVIREIQEQNQGADPDEVMAEVLQAQQEIRREKAEQQT